MPRTSTPPCLPKWTADGKCPVRAPRLFTPRPAIAASPQDPDICRHRLGTQPPAASLRALPGSAARLLAARVESPAPRRLARLRRAHPCRASLTRRSGRASLVPVRQAEPGLPRLRARVATAWSGATPASRAPRASYGSFAHLARSRGESRARLRPARGRRSPARARELLPRHRARLDFSVDVAVPGDRPRCSASARPRSCCIASLFARVASRGTARELFRTEAARRVRLPSRSRSTSTSGPTTPSAPGFGRSCSVRDGDHRRVRRAARWSSAAHRRDGHPARARGGRLQLGARVKKVVVRGVAPRRSCSRAERRSRSGAACSRTARHRRCSSICSSARTCRASS